jgi:cytochrome c biogenesis protein CcmG/thiol:disulfide interchange protein DsbE
LAAIAFGVRGVPETFFIDREGTIVGRVSGPVDAPLVAATLEAIIFDVDPTP